MNQDLALIEQTEGGLDRLIEQLRRNRGDLRLNANDFLGWSQGARFYPLLYMLTRVCHAKDWGSGVELAQYLLGHQSSLQIHHIFPKAQLYKHGYSRPDVNALANFTFLTQATNLAVSDRAPADYLEAIARTQPGVLESHWIPLDRMLWRVENYPDFLAARRELLATAANNFLDSLVAGTIPEPLVNVSVLDRKAFPVPGGVESEEEESFLWECSNWVQQQGLPEGELLYEVSDPATGEQIAVLDLAWPNGLQEGYSQPVALLIDEGQATEEAANRAGFRYFTDLDSFRTHVTREVLAQSDDASE